MHAPTAIFTALSLSVALAASEAFADVTISSDATANMTCSGGTCSPTATDAVLNVGDLETMLASGNIDVTTAGAGGIQASAIDVDMPFMWSVATTLTLDANRKISIEAPVSVAGGVLSLIVDGRGRKGTILFGPSGDVSFGSLASELHINGKAYQLEDSLPRLIEAIARNPRGAYALTADYDAHGKVYRTSTIPVAFSGKFNGLGHAISHFEIADEGGPSVGFFSSIAQGASVSSLRLTNISVSGPNSVGGLTGTNSGTIINASVGGTSIYGVLVGGISGFNEGKISYCSSHLKNVITNGPGPRAGGLVGQNQGVIDQSFARGKVESRQENANIGSLVGINSGDSIDLAGLITNSYATGSAKATLSSAAGGLVGYNPADSTIATSYSLGAAAAQPYAGGFAGSNLGSVSSSYWNTSTSGMSQGVGTGDSTGISGLTTAELQSALPPGFDPTIWAEDTTINNGFPYLIANPPRE